MKIPTFINQRCQYPAWQFCDTRDVCHNIDALSRKIFLPSKNPTKCIPRVTLGNHSTPRSKVKSEFQTLKSNAPKLFLLSRGKSRSFLVTWKITNLYKSSHQFFTIVWFWCAHDLHWFQIKTTYIESGTDSVEIWIDQSLDLSDLHGLIDFKSTNLPVRLNT